MGRFYFNNNTTQLDLKNALRLAEASLLAYRAESTVKSRVKDEWGFHKFKFFDVFHTQAFIAADKDLIVIAFRGTEPKSFVDWITDARAKLISGYLGRNHKGFFQAYNLVAGELYATLHQFQDNRQKIWVTGHSLGGALATLAVADLGKRGRVIHGLYTFGQPRVGSTAFAGHFNRDHKRRTFRFINNEDIVTRVPPRLMGYSHIGTSMYFDNHGRLHRGIRKWRMFLDSMVSTSARAVTRYAHLKNTFPNGIDDHGIDKYIIKIRKSLYEARKNSRVTPPLP